MFLQQICKNFLRDREKSACFPNQLMKINRIISKIFEKRAQFQIGKIYFQTAHLMAYFFIIFYSYSLFFSIILPTIFFNFFCCCCCCYCYLSAFFSWFKIYTDPLIVMNEISRSPRCTLIEKINLKMRTCTYLFFPSNFDLNMSTRCSQF